MRYIILILSLLFSSFLYANDRDKTAPLKELENELKVISRKLLEPVSFEKKVEINTTLIKRLKTILSRADSYDYPFDSIKTISRLYPEDQSFRVYTWQIAHMVDSLNDRSRQENFHFGIIQRKYVNKENKTEIIVIELKPNSLYNHAMESTILNQDTWFGALYYKPKNTEFGILNYPAVFYQINPVSGKIEKTKGNYYILLGWNGHDESTDYKIVETLNFDPNDPKKVNFGAPIFYYGSSPKSRVILEYGDNSPFSLNLAYVLEKGFFGKKKTLMLVYDHLQMPDNVRDTQMWQVGSDGSYDALKFVNKFIETRKGFFGYVKNVNVYVPDLKSYNPKEIEKMAKEEQKRLEKMGIEINKQNKKP